jgi:hypothetical protein
MGTTAMYVSEATEFLRQFKKDHPKLESEQEKAREIYWDKEPLSLEQRARLKASDVPQQGYVYQVKV